MTRNSSKWFWSILLSGLCTTSLIAETVSSVIEPLQRPAVQVRDPKAAFMVDVARVSSQIVAVGERGLILLSEDHEAAWQQAAVPVSNTLTAVDFFNQQYGMAAGHGGTVLVTNDGGKSWHLALDGKKAADLLLAQANRSQNARLIQDAERLVADGPDKPFLDIRIISSEHAIVVGAYGLAFETFDSGANWQPINERLANPGSLHLNVIAKRGARLLIAGEQGLLNLSLDNGSSFIELDSPYPGAFFTAQLLSDEEIVVAGLKGNVWYSANNGSTWEQISVPGDASITASYLSNTDELLMANQAGQVMRLVNQQLVPVSEKRFPPVNALLSLDSGILALTMEGIHFSQEKN